MIRKSARFLEKMAKTMRILSKRRKIKSGGRFGSKKKVL